MTKAGWHVGIGLALAAIGVALNMGRAGAQSGDVHEPRPDFSGTWSLDRNLSGDPTRTSFDAAPNQQAQTPARHGGGFGGAGGRGGYGQGGRAGPRSQEPVEGSTPDERARLAALTEQLKTGSATLNISHHDPSFVINDARDHTQFFQTTGTREDQLLGETTVPGATRWDGERLVTEYTLSSRRTLVYTYTLLPKSDQMVLRVRLDASQGPRGNGSELKLVYSRTNPPSK